MEKVGVGWNSKYKKNEIYFKFTVGNKDYNGVIGNGKVKLINNSKLNVEFINNKFFKINGREFKIVGSVVKTYDYKILME